jgi:hypothetical protein
MRHLALLYYVLSFTAGCISIGLCLLIYRQYRKTVLRDYAVFLAALALVLMYGMIVFCLVLVAVNLPRIGDPILRRVLRLFFLVSLVFFPVMLVEVLRQRLPALRLYGVFELFALPSYFLVINILSVVLCFRTLNQPPYLAGEELTEHFSQSFGITTREREIIPLLIEGRSYAEVAEALFISYKTVDNAGITRKQKERLKACGRQNREKTKSFYEHYGFVALKDRPTSLVLVVSTIVEPYEASESPQYLLYATSGRRSRSGPPSADLRLPGSPTPPRSKTLRRSAQAPAATPSPRDAPHRRGE